MATHSSVLAWRIPGTGEPGGLPSIGSHRVGHDWSDLAAAAAAAEHTHLLLNNHFTFSKMTLHKHMNPTVSQCPEKENRGTIFWTFLLTKCVNYQAFYKTIPYITTEASLVAQMVKRIWRRKWQPTPGLLPGKSHGQRSLVGYSPWGCKELTQLSNFTFCLFCLSNG